MTSFASLLQLVSRFAELGATRIFFKALSENDNSKQQVYLGSSFEVLTYFRHGQVASDAALRSPIFKAGLNLYWVDTENADVAPGAQLILYPQYPEVRLSGFLRGCSVAPGQYMRPVPASERKGVDGRVLFFGTTADGRTLASLAPAQSDLANEALLSRSNDGALFNDVPLPGAVPGGSREVLLATLRDIQLQGFVPSMRLDRSGARMSYAARNGGGYTLEALLGIRPNAVAAPDFHGWEVKGYSGSKVTLMTPEPDGGFYGAEGVGKFVHRYGRHLPDTDQRYFTGSHRYGIANRATSMTLGLTGFDAVNGKIVDVKGCIYLSDIAGELAASWSFSSLLTHWNRKHASAVYVPYESDLTGLPRYRYKNPILLGQHTDFAKYLGAKADGKVIFDPGSKIEGISTPNPRVKARSQFRMGLRNLGRLYETFESIEL